jgi:hypothetical protein
MKQVKKTSVRSLLALAFVCACVLGVARADVRDARVISARAGGVNLVSGDVKVRRVASSEWVALSTQDELKGGDTVRTGSDGQVEILLNPGSYFRAGGGTEFTLAGADIGDLRVELARGSAVVEAAGYGDMNLSIEVAVPGAVVRVARGGVYRFNAPAAGPAEVVVTNGRAVVGGTKVKGGKVARISGAGVEVSKFDKQWRDELDLWSRERGKQLAKANEKLNRRALRSAFGSYSDTFGGGWGSGLWAFNTYLRCYTFLPYGYGWRSPYGFDYGTGVYAGPETGWRPVYPPPGGRSAGGSGGGTWGGGGGSGGSGGAGPGNSNPGGGRDFHPMNPTPMTPPSRIEPTERPERGRTAEPLRPTRDQ